MRRLVLSLAFGMLLGVAPAFAWTSEAYDRYSTMMDFSPNYIVNGRSSAASWLWGTRNT